MPTVRMQEHVVVDVGTGVPYGTQLGVGGHGVVEHWHEYTGQGGVWHGICSLAHGCLQVP